MTIDLSALASHDKLLFDIALAPVQGKRFQPTGFPDLGAATFSTKGGTNLLVESAQSMANRFEAVCWDEAKQAAHADVAGISFVRVVDANGKFLTSSMLEAHRLNSVYIEKADKGKFHETLTKEIGFDDSKPIDRPAFVRAVFRYDVGSLLHGVFLESIGGRLRLARAMTAFIEAEGVAVAASGGVKNDHLMPGKGEGKGAAEGYGNVPFHRDEFTADAIGLFVNIDTAQIHGYGLGEEATRLLFLLALYKVRGLVDGKLRLRTACDLAVVGATASRTGMELPRREELVKDLRSAITACRAMFAKDDGITQVTYGA